MANLRDKSQRDFRLTNSTTEEKTSLDFNKIKVGKQVLSNDVSLDIPISWNGQKQKYIRMDRHNVDRAIEDHDIKKLREISNFFYDKSGIYSRLCRYMAYLYRYDWFITPQVYDGTIKSEKIVDGWYKASCLLENSRLKKLFGEIALKVIKNGCYYGYRLEQKSAGYLQELPANYCRSRYTLNGVPAIEFNLKFFDDSFKDTVYKVKILKMFPKEIQKAYLSFKKGTLPADFNGDDKGWFLLDPEKTVKFNLSNSDAPLFVSVIPHIIDLDEAQDLDKQKMKQQLLRLIVQQFPLDKNGDIIFDEDEMNALHSNAVQMLGRAIGVEVLSTLADVKVEDLSDNNTVSSVDQLDKVERTVYNEAGVSQGQFNTDGAIALEKSIANDEATMTNLVQQFEEYAESLLKPFNKNPKRLKYVVQILPTTIYNYKELAKLYKEQTMLGFSKLLPQVALGQTQSSIIATALFENEYMNLDEVFIAPQMSSTMSSNKAPTSETSGDTQSKNDGQRGRPELPDDQKTEKTIRNIESEG